MPTNNAQPAAGTEAQSSSPSVENFENTQTASTQDIADVLHFDPFKKGDEIPAGTADPKSNDSAGKPGATAAKPEVKANTPADPAATNTATPAPSDQERGWQAIAEQALAVAQASQKPAAATDVKTEEDADAPPAYNFTIPKPLMAALTGDDPVQFEQGLVAYAQGMAGAIHQQIFAHMQKKFEPLLAAIPQQVFQQIEQKAELKRVSDDFYGKYPQFNNPAFKPVVKQIGEAVAKRLGKTKWDEELRDEVGKEVMAAFAAVIGSAPAAAAKPAFVPPKQLSGTGARPAVDSSDSLGREIADVLFSNDS